MQLVVEDRVTDEEYYQVRRTQMLKNELAELEARSLTLDDERKKVLDMEIEQTKAAMRFQEGRAEGRAASDRQQHRFNC